MIELLSAVVACENQHQEAEIRLVPVRSGRYRVAHMVVKIVWAKVAILFEQKFSPKKQGNDLAILGPF